MDGYTDGYVKFVLEQLTQAKLECADSLVLIEQRLDFSCWVPEGFGTGDCLIVADKLTAQAENLLKLKAELALGYGGSVSALKSMGTLEMGAPEDELIIKCDRRSSLAAVCEQMGWTPLWAKGLLLRMDRYEYDFYKKDQDDFGMFYVKEKLSDSAEINIEIHDLLVHQQLQNYTFPPLSDQPSHRAVNSAYIDGSMHPKAHIFNQCGMPAPISLLFSHNIKPSFFS